jgi:hypothetical protein
MRYWRELRDCPKCGAHKGFACHKWDDMPGCPQHYLAEGEERPEIPMLPVWPLPTDES